MELTLNYRRGIGYIVSINGEDPFTFQEKAIAYRLALNELLNIVEAVAEGTESLKYGEYFWCLTGEVLRPENNTDLLRLLYSAYLIELKKSVIDKVSIKSDVPKWWLERLKKLNCKVEKRFFDISFSRLKNYFKILYWILSVATKNIVNSFMKSSECKYPLLIDINAGPHDNRLDSFEKYLKLKCSFYSGQEHKISGIAETRVVHIRRSLHILDFIRALGKLFRIKNNYKKFRIVINHKGWYYYLIRLKSLIKLFDLLLFEAATKRFLDKNRIKKIVHVSTLTKPSYRVLWKEASNRDIHLTLIGSRTFKDTSASDIILKPDIESYNGCSIPQEFIVKDLMSKETLTKEFPNLKSNVYVGSRTEISDKEITSPSKQEHNKDGLLVYLCLTHLIEPSWSLLELTKQFLDKAQFTTSLICIRFHPSNQIKFEEVSELFAGYKVINHTGNNFTEIQHYRLRKLGITGPSTAGFDLSKFVDVNVWLPFVWGDGILFNLPSMNKEVVFETAETFLNSFDWISSLLKEKSRSDFNREVNPPYFEILKELNIV